MERRKLDAFEWACLALVAAGLALRAWRIFHPDLVDDGARYAAMATSFDRYHEFLEPWNGAGVYSQHYPPLFPLLLAAGFALFGPSLTSIEIAEAACGALLVGVALFTTWDLHGRRRGFAVAAVVATMSFFLTSEAAGLTESLVAATFALTIWAILRSLTQPHFILIAGLAAAAGYLTKSSVGPFFLVAGAAGFAWRFSYMRWRVFREKSYLAAAAIFGAFVLLWAGRNVLRHGWPNWETQPYATESVRYLFREASWWTILPTMLVWSFVVLAILALPFLLPGFRDAARRWREEPTSALWMAVVTPTIVASLFAAAFFANEHQSDLLSPDIVRYVLVAVIPLLWIGMRGLDLDPDAERAPPSQGAALVRRRASLAVAGVALFALILALRGSPSSATIGSLYAGALLSFVALGLLLASRVAWWQPQARVDGSGQRSWRAVKTPAPGGARALGAIVLVALGVVVGMFVWWDAAPFFLAAGAALLLRNARERVVATAILLLAATLCSAGASIPYDRIASDAGARMAPGDSVALVGAEPAFAWPFLPADANLTRDPPNATWIIDYTGAPTPPQGFTKVAEWHAQRWALPGASLSRALFGSAPSGDAGVYALYRKG